MVAIVQALTRYPIKGLSGQMLKSVQLEAGQGLPFDRKFGFARPDSGFDQENPKPLPKTKFYMLALDAKLALLSTEYDDSRGVLKISSGQHESIEFNISNTDGRQNASQFLQSFLSLPDNEMPQLCEASPHRFTDVSVVSASMMNAVSIINQSSVHEFSKAIGQEVHPGRFRGNILLSGLPAFIELEMIGQNCTIGEAQFKFVKRTRRCPATEVDLTTGERNIKTPKLLREHYGHMDMGVYAEVICGGIISEGDSIIIG